MQLKDLDYPSIGEITIIIHTKLIRGATLVKLVNANSKVWVDLLHEKNSLVSGLTDLENLGSFGC